MPSLLKGAHPALLSVPLDPVVVLVWEEWFEQCGHRTLCMEIETSGHSTCTMYPLQIGHTRIYDMSCCYAWLNIEHQGIEQRKISKLFSPELIQENACGDLECTHKHVHAANNNVR